MNKFLISIIIGLVLLVVVIYNVNLTSLSEKISTASIPFVILSFFIIICFTTLKSLRWKIILGQGKFSTIFYILQIGGLLTNILPAQLQEPIRVMLLKKKENIGLGYGISSILLERLMDVLGLLSIGIILVVFFIVTDSIQFWIFELMTNTMIIFSFILSFFILFMIKPNLFSKVFTPLKKYHRFEKFYIKIDSLMLELSNSFKELSKKPLNLFFSFFITITMWLVNFIAVYILFLSVGFQISPLLVLFGFVGVSLGMALPQSPGYIGTFEIIWLGAFSSLGYGDNSAILTVGIIYHLLIFSYSTILGILGIVNLRLSFKDIFSYAKKS